MGYLKAKPQSLVKRPKQRAIDMNCFVYPRKPLYGSVQVLNQQTCKVLLKSLENHFYEYSMNPDKKL